MADGSPQTAADDARQVEIIIPGPEAPAFGRSADFGGIDEDTRTVDLTWTTGAGVKRRNWMTGEIYIEELVVSENAIDMTRLNGGAPLLDTHDQWDLEGVLGVVERAWIEKGEGKASVRFAKTDKGTRALDLVRDKIIRNVSVGYEVRRFEVDRSGDIPVYRAVDWQPTEISLVPVGADAGAGVRKKARISNPTGDAQHKESNMTDVVEDAGEKKPEVKTEARKLEVVENVIDVTAYKRIARGFGLDDGEALAAIERKETPDDWTRRLVNERAEKAEKDHVSHIHVQRDEGETRRIGMEDAMVAQLTGATPSDNGKRFMENRSMVDFAAERLGVQRIPGGFGQREDLLRRAFHTTSDFPLLMENALNRSLAARYAAQEPTYRRIARQRSYQDFRDHSTVRAGDFPTLQPVSAEAGEIKAGTFGEAREKTAVKAYGVTVGLSRQLLVNDGLGGIQQVLDDRGVAVARFEENTFYAMLLSGSSNNGPTLIETGRQVFNTTDGTLAGTPSVVDVDNLGKARAALRKRKSVDGSPIGVAGSILLVGPDKETEAEKIVATVQPQQASNVNPFSGKLTLIVSAQITGNAWYIFADTGAVPCFEWGLLDGYTAPRFRIEEVFGRQGTQMSLEHDFGCGAIDYRGGYKNAGA